MNSTQRIMRTRTIAAAILGVALSGAAAATPSLEAVAVVGIGKDRAIKLSLSEPLAGEAKAFVLSNPPRLVVDLPETRSILSGQQVELVDDLAQQAKVIEVPDRTRVVISLSRASAHRIDPVGTEVMVRLGEASAIVAEELSAPGDVTTPAQAAIPTTQSDSNQDSKQGASIVSGQALRGIDFRRGAEGEAKIFLTLAHPKGAVDVSEQGSNIVVRLPGAAIDADKLGTLDVSQFVTPVQSIDVTRMGDDVVLRLQSSGRWTHSAYQTDERFTIEVRKLDDSAAGGTVFERTYTGKKMTLEFEQIGLRDVLKVMADFTGLNIIAADSVSGNLTLRLKEVPWDQALDLILDAKGLDKRRNGDVIWVAPKTEIAQREREDYESRTRLNEIEPLRTETFQIKYHKGADVATLLKSPERSVLSQRGTVVVDGRSNKLFVQDTRTRLDDVRRMVEEIDVPVRQVMIEARIVEADQNFSRNLGVRMGTGAVSSNNVGATASGQPIPRFTIGAGLSSTAYQAGQIDSQPDFSKTLQVNLAAQPIGGNAPGVLSAVLWNSLATRFLDLELSALEADGRGKVISRPRVLTADQVKASIEQGVEIPYQQATSSGATSVAFRKANLSLSVKPQITPDGKVMLTLDVTKDSPNTLISSSGGVAINTRRIQTEVLVENGGTVVIGGVYQEDERNNVNKIPVLGDIPYAGALFRNSEKATSKTELLVFVTPRIMANTAVTY